MNRSLAARLLALLLLPPLLALGQPAVAVFAGAALVLVLRAQPLPHTNRWAALSLQAAIVLLGLRMDLATVWSLGAGYFPLTAAVVLGTLGLGLVAARWLAVERPGGLLLASGTAICGGTAIAGVSSLVRAKPQQIAVALGLVFVLNLVAMLVFPPIGRWLELDPVRFGLWAALAIHDTSSVLATAALYGDHALEVATTVKLTRTLWLIPLLFTLGVWLNPPAERRAGWRRHLARLRPPNFLLLFLTAVGLASLAELPGQLVSAASLLSQALLVLALFLVGTGLSRETLAAMRGPLLKLGLGLWFALVPATLALVCWWG